MNVREALMGHAIGRYGDGFSLARLAQHLNLVDPLDAAGELAQAAA